MATVNVDDPGEDEQASRSWYEAAERDAAEAVPDEGFTCGNCERGRCSRCSDPRCSCCYGGDPEPWPPRW